MEAQADVDAAAQALSNATAALAYVGADYTALNTLIDESSRIGNNLSQIARMLNAGSAAAGTWTS